MKTWKESACCYCSYTILPVGILSTWYCSPVLPYYQYCDIVWASDFPTNLRILYMLQKRAIRIISQVRWCDHKSTLFKKHNQFNIFDNYKMINKLQTACFMYKYITNQLRPALHTEDEITFH